MDYQNIATTVFTPLELGTVGLSEEAAIEKYGKENIDSFVSEFVPLEWTLLEKQEKMKCFAKIVINKLDSDRVLGLYVTAHISYCIHIYYNCLVCLTDVNIICALCRHALRRT